MHIRSLHTRIVAAFAVLLLVAQALELAIANGIISTGANQEIQQNLGKGERLFNLLHEDNNRRLVQAASILSSDYAFINAIATVDRGTIVSALLNHGARIKADIAMLAGVDNTLIANTLRENRAGEHYPFPDLIKAAERQGQATSVVVLDGRLYQLVVVPVLAPLPIAWLTLGFVIDDRFARNLNSLTSLDVSFLEQSQSSGQWEMLATTLSSERSGMLPTAMPRGTAQIGKDTSVLRLGDEDYLVLFSTLLTPNNNTVVAVLQQSQRSALEPLRRLQSILLILGGISLLATFVASNKVARSITNPIGKLVAQANRIEQGDYSQSVAQDRNDEIGQLALAFDHMREGISAREDKITELAYRDSLTGLPNRTLFSDRLNQAINNARRTGQFLAVLIMDLNRFKEVNDILGHHIGDLLLKEIAKRLQTVLLRDADTVARLGGDEFGVLLQATDAQGAQIIARKLIETIDQPILLEGQQVIAGGSIGMAIYPDHGEEINTLMRHADLAMYASKRNHSDYAIYDPSLEGRSQQHLSLMAELRHAIDHNEFALYYQPKVSIATGTVGQVEALVRWIHPQRGLIPPDQFIPFAENTGYVKTITQWVIAKALEQRRAWEDKGLPLRISINISARDLLNSKLPEMFAELMAKYGAEPDWLALEITESAIMTDPQSALDVLYQLHGMGLRMSVDDFGTGYSSLAYLKKLPVDELKIDQSFITNMDSNEDDSIIVRSTVDLGHNMGLQVVAEGVETEVIWNMLDALGCDLIQGYYVSRPLPPEAFEKWMADSRWKVAAGS